MFNRGMFCFYVCLFAFCSNQFMYIYAYRYLMHLEILKPRIVILAVFLAVSLGHPICGTKTLNDD